MRFGFLERHGFVKSLSGSTSNVPGHQISRFVPRAGFVILRQIFVRRSHSGGPHGEPCGGTCGVPFLVIAIFPDQFAIDAGFECGFGAIAHIEITKQCGHMDFCCRLGDAQDARDFLIGFAMRQKLQDFSLPPSEMMLVIAPLPFFQNDGGNLLHLLPVMVCFAASDTCAEPQIAERLALRIEVEQSAENAKDAAIVGD